MDKLCHPTISTDSISQMTDSPTRVTSSTATWYPCVHPPTNPWCSTESAAGNVQCARRVTKRQSPKPKETSRRTFSQVAQHDLEMEFNVSPYLTACKRQYLAEKLNLTERQVRVWFQNRRMRIKNERRNKRRSTEVTKPESLQNQCENVTLSTVTSNVPSTKTHVYASENNYHPCSYATASNHQQHSPVANEYGFINHTRRQDFQQPYSQAQTNQALYHACTYQNWDHVATEQQAIFYEPRQTEGHTQLVPNYIQSLSYHSPSFEVDPLIDNDEADQSKCSMLTHYSRV